MGKRSRRFHRNPRNQQGTVRASALCAQVRRALEWGLAELSDDRFSGLEIEVVVPHPNVSRMLVVLRHTQEQNFEECEQTYHALRGAEGLLRSRIAEAIHRKRTPHLAFTLIGSAATRAAEAEDRAK